MISAHVWLREGTVFAGEFDESHDLSSRVPYDRAYGYPRAEEAVDYASEWIASRPGESFFLFLHLMDTHFPHYMDKDARAFLEAGAGNGTPPAGITEVGGLEDPDRPLTPEERAWLDALYDGSLHYTDRHLARLFKALQGGPGETIIVVTSDHGEALAERPGRFGHGLPWYETVGRIPLIVHAPDTVEPGVVEATSESVDLVPTILGLLDMESPRGKRFDGRDLAPAIRRGGSLPPRPAFARRAIRDGRHKCLFLDGEDRLLAEEAPAARELAGELYDLHEDPGESADLWDEKPEVVERLLGLYRARMTALHARYVASRSNRQPESSFAISPRHLSLLPERRCTGNASEIESFFGSGREWLLFCDPQGEFLLGEAGAGPVRLQVPVPDGAYLLTLGISGGAILQTGGSEEKIHLLAGPFDPWQYFPWPVEAVEAGPVSIRDGMLDLSLLPAAEDGPLALEYVGFRPVREGEPAVEIDPERLERLRTLGYAD
jgi:hypothetical protein